MRKRILLIDDEPDFTHMLRLSLESAGYYRVREENDPAHAVEAAREFAPDLVLLDVMMPGADGSDVAARLRGRSELAETPVVFLTALVCAADAPGGACDSGGHLFLSKSAPLPTLIDWVRQVLEATPVQLAERWEGQAALAG